MKRRGRGFLLHPVLRERAGLEACFIGRSGGDHCGGERVTDLCVGIVILLKLAADETPSLVGIDEVGARVVDDAGTTGIHKSLYACSSCFGEECLGALDVDIVREVPGGFPTSGAKHWTCCVYDGVWLYGI